jgi:hypothetical protein
MPSWILFAIGLLWVAPLYSQIPDLTSRQDYAQGYNFVTGKRGVNAWAAWQLGARGAGIEIADVEMDWDLDHIEFAHKTIERPYASGAVLDGAVQHGTNVLGILVAADDGQGVSGLAPEAEVSVWEMTREVLGQASPGQTIRDAANALDSGDILQLELSETYTGAAGPGPADTRQSVWDAVDYAVQQGLVVIMAAGNGSENLEASLYDSYRSRSDHGAIRVGAGNGFQERLPISCYGSPVHLQAWGDTNIVTTGTYQWSGMTSVEGHHGETFGPDDHSAFSYQFSGTSAALPMVSAVAALVQGWAKDSLGRVFTSSEMRALLIRTGHAQASTGPTGHIGPIPDAVAAIETLRAENPTRLHAQDPLVSSFQIQNRILLARESLELNIRNVRGETILQSRLRAREQLHLNEALSGRAPGRYWIAVRSSSAETADGKTRDARTQVHSWLHLAN